MTTTSRIFPVLSALYTAYDGLSSDLPVKRGKPVGSVDGDYLAVGWAPGVTTAVAGNQTLDGDTRSSPTKESFTVTCYMETWTGDTDNASIEAREQRLFDYWAKLQTLHRNTPELEAGVLGTASGSAGWALISGFDFIPDETSQGFVAGLIFYISVEAFI